MTIDEMLTAIYRMPEKPNWDSYGALPTTEVAKATARNVAELLAQSPTVSPVSNGGIEFGFDGPRATLWVKITPNGTIALEHHVDPLPVQSEEGTKTK